MKSSLTGLSISREDALIILDKILGDEERISIAEEEQSALWCKLKDLTPVDESSSFHIIEHIYMLDGQKYSAMWEISSNAEDPFSIELVRPRKRLIPQQLELF